MHPGNTARLRWASALALALLPFAQAMAAPEDPSQAPARDTIIVTGSRLAVPALKQAEPVLSILARQIEAFGTSHFADALNDVPGFRGSLTPEGAQNEFGQGVNFLNSFGLGSNRTLVLVDGHRFVSSNAPSLFSGATPGNQVDLNAIPSILVERVDRLAIGGAPAYGSDAIAATVNVRLRRGLTGIEASALSGITGQGDNLRWRIGAAGGSSFAGGRGHVTLATSFDRVDGLAASQRAAWRANVANAANPCTVFRAGLCSSFGTVALLGPAGRSPASDGRVNPGIGFNDAPDDGNPASILIRNRTLAATATGGVVSSGPGAYGWRFATDGSLVPYNPGTLYSASLSGPLAAAANGSGGDGVTLIDKGSLLSTSERFNAAMLLDFELSDALRIYADAIHYRGLSDEVSDLPTFNAVQFGGASGALTFRTDNPLLSPQARSQLAALGYGQTFQISRANTDLADRSGSARSEVWRLVSGLKGSASMGGRELSWDVSVNYGRSTFTDRAEAMDRQKFVNAVNVALIDGKAACSPVATVSGLGAGAAPVADPACVPLNLFGEGAPSAAALAYVIAHTRARSRLEQIVVSGNVAAAPFALFGNPVAASVGAEHRTERARFTPDAFLASGKGRSSPIPQVAGSYRIAALFGELAAPLILPENDALFAKLLVFARVRHVDSNHNGAFTAWSAGGSFAPLADIELRGNYTRSYRAPAILEMFQPQSTVSLAVPDLCSAANIAAGPVPEVRRANCQAFLGRFPAATPLVAATASVPARTGGNPGLANEIGENFTFGASLRPRFAPGLTLALDYIAIAVRNPIANLGVGDIAAGCFDNPDFDTADPANGNRFCALIRRDASGQVIADSQSPGVTTGFVNGERITLRAVQASFAFATSLEGIALGGSLELAGDLFHLRRRVVNITGVAPSRSDGLVGDPRWQGQVRLHYADTDWGVSAQANITGKQLLMRGPAFDAPGDRGEFHHFKGFATLDAALHIVVTGKARLNFAVTNVFNRVGQNYSGIVVPISINDALGRRFALSLNTSF
jgi:outer membrane receptor protein involved in Fe transport